MTTVDEYASFGFLWMMRLIGILGCMAMLTFTVYLICNFIFKKYTMSKAFFAFISYRKWKKETKLRVTDVVCLTKRGDQHGHFALGIVEGMPTDQYIPVHVIHPKPSTVIEWWHMDEIEKIM